MKKRFFAGLAALLLMAFLSAGAEEAGTGALPSLKELNGKIIGVQTGSSFDKMVETQLPEARIEYYNNKADLAEALIGKKIDAFIVDEPVARLMSYETPRLTWLPEYLDTFSFGYVFAKNEQGAKLRDEFNAFLDSLPAGTAESLKEKWLAGDENRKTMPDPASLPATNGTLQMATEADYAPFTYVRDGRVVGYDLEIVALFCQERGYGMQIVNMNFDGILPSVQSGKCQIAGSGITITPEREESVLFSKPYFTGGTVAVVLRPDGAAAAGGRQGDAPEGIAASFEKTFIRENRWQMFLSGIGTTLLITVLSLLFGTVLGFMVYMACRNGNPVANGIARFFIWLVRGMPVVVLLMILYYIVFASIAIPGITVAVIGFTLTFAASVFGLLKMGVGAIDRGQFEAAYALGYSNRRTFFQIILPQAVPHVLPAYQGEIVELIKATAIVGYIAVQDLTKMGDIVRSRTYEAFFPLIAVTVVYFVLEGLFAFGISRIRIGSKPKKGTQPGILKGVRRHD